MGYDVIGDIHGQAGKLEALLGKLGYAQSDGAWRHPGRTAVFVGDFIDRGPHQLKTLDTVRAMVESGSALAVLGNHELNAIAWYTPDPKVPGDYLRPRFEAELGAKNRSQHERFLAEVGDDSELHRDHVAWFMTLPLWLDLPGIRVVHACWHQRFMDFLQPHLTTANQLKPGILEAATREPADEAEKDNAEPSIFKAVEALTKGLEIPLPQAHFFRDKDGHERRRVRVRWWDVDATTYPEAAMAHPEFRKRLPTLPIPEHARIQVPTDKPLFFGHYWLTGRPTLQAPHVACVDYSAGKGGDLVAYRWDGERRLDAGNFVWTS